MRRSRSDSTGCKRQAISGKRLWSKVCSSLLKAQSPKPKARPGYIFLLSVLFVSAIAVSALGSYLLLSIASLESGATFQESAQALEYAQSCAERALLNLFHSSSYEGDESIFYSNGECYILQPGGFGYENRTVCTEGVSGNHTRRLEIVVESILPSIEIYSWQEVASITSCSY